ncbi:hypothetical protein RRG08_054568 [Elysia crispata]|uniref:Uncharacterized protein n=1 Tax=Elysia crispata TaxID=231223 RepID=A0AAE1E864_9GAST|nr:hypothetical protein RRG08_054568 [Elysia crispata]
MSVYTDKEVLEMLENDDEVEDWLSDDSDEEELSDLEVDDVATVLAEQPGRDNVNPEPEQRGDEAEETIDPGPTHPPPLFRPERQPGLHLPACHTREQMFLLMRGWLKIREDTVLDSTLGINQQSGDETMGAG